MIERCNWAPGGPQNMERCANHATGGLRFILRPAEKTGERFGIRSMLSFIADLPICARCFPQATPHNCLSADLRRSLARVAQARNKKIPVDWSRTLTEHVPFDEPEYIALRRSQAAAAQPEPANG